jgi:uncharacterized spore protein YtfJ
MPANVSDLLASVRESIEQGANARAVFGEPQKEDGVTVIPVAKVSVRGGGGGGMGDMPEEGKHRRGRGLGMGMMIQTKPVGFIRIMNGEAEFVPIMDRTKLAMAGMAMSVVGMLMTAHVAKGVTRIIQQRMSR